MTDKIIGAGSTIQLLISQKGVQALVALMVISTTLAMVAIGRNPPDWLIMMASGLLGLYFDVPGKQMD